MTKCDNDSIYLHLTEEESKWLNDFAVNNDLIRIEHVLLMKEAAQLFSDKELVELIRMGTICHADISICKEIAYKLNLKGFMVSVPEITSKDIADNVIRALDYYIAEYESAIANTPEIDRIVEETKTKLQSLRDYANDMNQNNQEEFLNIGDVLNNYQKNLMELLDESIVMAAIRDAGKSNENIKYPEKENESLIIDDDFER